MYTISQIAKKYKVSPKTVKIWIDMSGAYNDGNKYKLIDIVNYHDKHDMVII